MGDIVSNLVGWWQLDEPSGATNAANSIAGGNAGLPVGLTTTVGKIGPYCRVFDGSTNANDKLIFSDPVNMQDLNPISIAMWTYRTNNGGSNLGRYYSKGTSASSKGFAAYCDISNDHAIVVVGGRWTTSGVWHVNPATTIPTNEWHHIVITYSWSSVNNTPVVYVDGNSVTVTLITTPVGPLLSDVGLDHRLGNAGTDNRAWDGYFDDFRIYNRILVQADVTDLFTWSSNIAAVINGVGSVSAPGLVNSSMRAIIAGTGAINGDLRFAGLHRFTQEGLAQAYHVYHGARIFG